MTDNCSTISLILSKCSCNDALPSTVIENNIFFWKNDLSFYEASCNTFKLFQISTEVFPVQTSWSILSITDNLRSVISSLSHSSNVFWSLPITFGHVLLPRTMASEDMYSNMANIHCFHLLQFSMKNLFLSSNMKLGKGSMDTSKKCIKINSNRVNC